MSPPRISLVFGAMSPSLSEQLRGVVDSRRLAPLEADAAAVARLCLRGVLSEVEACRARQRIVLRVERLVRGEELL